MDYVRFPLGLLSGPCDPSRSPSGHSWSVTGPFSRHPGLSIAHVPRTRRRCPPASETARQRPSASRLSRPPDYLGRHPSRCAPFRPVGVVLLDCAPEEPVTANEAAAIVMAQCQRKRRRLQTLWLSSSNVALSPIGRQSSPQTRHATCAAGLVSRLVTTLMLPCVALGMDTPGACRLPVPGRLRALDPAG